MLFKIIPGFFDCTVFVSSFSGSGFAAQKDQRGGS